MSTAIRLNRNDHDDLTRRPASDAAPWRTTMNTETRPTATRTPKRLSFSPRLCAAALAVAAVLVAMPARAQFASGNMVYTYDIAPAGAINSATSSATCYGAANGFTFTVPESFTYNSVSLGLNITHASRGEVQAFLRPPGAATPTQIFAASTNTSTNYDIMMSRTTDTTVPNLNDGTTDITAEPYFNRMVYNSVFTLAPFLTGAANGSWTLYVCDRNTNSNGTVGTLNRARLVLTTVTAPANVCSSSVTIDWGANGGGDNATGADYPVAGLSAGGVTMTREAYGSNPNGGTTVEANQKTVSTSQFGATYGYYQMRFTAPATLAAREGTNYWARFRLAPAVRDLQWGSLDVDWQTSGGGNGGWEDAVRITGTDADDLGGTRVPYAMVYANGTPSFQFAGDFVEGDTGNVVDASNAGNSYALFKGSVKSVRSEYWELDEPATTATQRIGISDATFCAFDFGDAPATYGTQLSGTGTTPKHVLGNRLVYLGTNAPDGESDSQPNSAASGDNLAAVTPPGTVDDEDGVIDDPWPKCPGNGTYTLQVRVNNRTAGSAYLYGWIDWNRGGTFETSERSNPVTVNPNTVDGTSTVTWSGVPANCGGTTATYARFRITSASAFAQTPTDTSSTYAPDGEVEDFWVADSTLPVTVAYVTSEFDRGALTVRWATATETANGGFDVWGRRSGGAWALLASVPSQGPDSFEPLSYEVAVDAEGVDEIRLDDVSLFGERREHGPFRVGETAGEEPEAMTLDWAAIRAENGMPPVQAPGLRPRALGTTVRASAAAKKSGLLQVRQKGIQRVTHEELLAAGIDLAGTSPAAIAVVNNGAGVPRYVYTQGATFGAGSYLEFYAAPQLTLASPYDAFVLTVNQALAVQPSTLLAPGGSAGVVAAEDPYRPDRTYSFASPNGDPWFDQGILANGKPASATRSFDLPDLASGKVELDLKVWGYGDWPGSFPLDHHIAIFINGTEVTQGWFDGVTAFERTVDVTRLVSERGNTLEVRVPGDTGFAYDYIALEGFVVRYPRRTVALGQRFDGTLTGAGTAISGFGEGQKVAVWRLSGKSWQRGEQSATGGQVTAPAGEVHAAAPAGIVKPGISAGVPEPLSLATAQYLIVTHPALVDPVTDLAALETARGYTTQVVTVDRIWAAYSDHAPSADALRKFITASSRKGKLEYVLLVGADSTDPYDHLGRGSISFVPTDYRLVQYISFSPTDETLGDTNNDSVSEMAIGRLPVRTPSEVQAAVAKLRAWDQALASTARSALLSAGASDQSGTFSAINRSYAGTLNSWATSLAPVDELGVAPVRNAVLAAMNAGTPLVSFVGHASMGQWDFTPLLRWQDVATLGNVGRPNLVVQWGCWNSYYVEPNLESISARLLNTPDVGAVATIGATTLTTDASHQALGGQFFLKVNQGAATVGKALRAAKAELAKAAKAKDAILGMTLLGDPATPLPR